MRHKYKGRKLGTDYSHTKAIKRGLVQALFLNDRIKTNLQRAKEIRPDVDKVITWAKKGDLHSRRLAIAALGNDKELVREIFEKVSQGMFEGRNGGYTRIMKLGPRKGDAAEMVIMELVTEPVSTKDGGKAAGAGAKKATPKKATPKKVEKAADADKEKKESVLDVIEDNIHAAEETFAENVQEEGMEQLAQEREEAAKGNAKAEEKAAEKVEEAREEAEIAEEEHAEEAKAAKTKKVEKAEGDSAGR